MTMCIPLAKIAIGRGQQSQRCRLDNGRYDRCKKMPAGGFPAGRNGSGRKYKTTACFIVVYDVGRTSCHALVQHRLRSDTHDQAYRWGKA